MTESFEISSGTRVPDRRDRVTGDGVNFSIFSRHASRECGCDCIVARPIARHCSRSSSIRARIGRFLLARLRRRRPRGVVLHVARGWAERCRKLGCASTPRASCWTLGRASSATSCGIATRRGGRVERHSSAHPPADVYDWEGDEPLRPAASGHDHLRSARAWHDAPSVLRRRASGNVRRARREDSVPAVARHHGNRVLAAHGLRQPRPAASGREARLEKLLGLQPVRLLCACIRSLPRSAMRAPSFATS